MERRRGGRPWSEVAEAWGTYDRKLRDWRSGRLTFALFETVDPILDAMGLQWWDVWPEDEYPEIARRLAA